VSPEERTRRIDQFFGQFSSLPDKEWEALLIEVATRVREALAATGAKKQDSESGPGWA